MAVKKTTAAKKVAPAKKKPVATKATEKSAAAPTAGDRKGMAAKARQLKSELLSIRFNIQAPNLTEYRKKRRELATVLSQLN